MVEHDFQNQFDDPQSWHYSGTFPPAGQYNASNTTTTKMTS
jgi:hypothetical protein